MSRVVELRPSKELKVADHFTTICAGEGSTATVLAALGHTIAFAVGVEGLALEA